MFCTNCGATVIDGTSICPACGASLGQEPQNPGANNAASAGAGYSGPTNSGYNQGNAGYHQAYNNAPVTKPVDPRYNYDPISTWGYIGYSLLFVIPLVGFILAIVFAFSGSGSINRRNYARSVCILWIIGTVVFGTAVIVLHSMGYHFYRGFFHMF